MTKYIDLHPFQMKIIKKLMFLENARFRNLKINGVTTDHLTCNTNKLIKNKFINKDDNNIYSLTTEGKEFGNRMDEQKRNKFCKNISWIL